MKILKYAVSAALCAVSLVSCTDLDETLYDQVGTSNYYNTKSDVIRATFRPFEHAFWSIQSRHVLNELTADQLITPTRDGWWDDGGKWRRLHYHEWNVEDGGDAQTEWNGCFQGIMQANYVIEDLDKLEAAKFGFSQPEFDNLKAQCRVLRAWFYLRLLDAFRNVPLAVSYSDVSLNTETQVEPKVVFDFIETELKECIPMLVEKTALGTNANIQGQWTKAAAASLLVRLYLNAGIYVGEERYSDCETVAQDIVDGKYGKYEVADRWDAAFDWDNDNCDEVIFGFPADQGYTYWQYQGDTYWWTVPARARYYFNDYFVNAVQGYIGEAVLILDWESGGNSAFGNVAYAKQILDRIYERTGVKPLIYMSGSVCRECDWSSVVAGDYGLWQAYYTTSGGYQPGASVYSQPYWGDLVMLQYSSSGSLSGYGGNLDMNVFYGDVETWKAYAGGSGVTVTPAAPVLDPAQQCQQVDGGNETIKSGQLHSANFTGRVITADGVVGEETNRQKVRVLQRALNADYAAGIAEDGEAGSETYGALGSHYVEAGETQFMVTAAEILLLLHGYDPAGVECPGVFGDGLGAAVEAFQRDNGLTIDRICGVATFSALIA